MTPSTGRPHLELATAWNQQMLAWPAITPPRGAMASRLSTTQQVLGPRLQTIALLSSSNQHKDADNPSLLGLDSHSLFESPSSAFHCDILHPVSVSCYVLTRTMFRYLRWHHVYFPPLTPLPGIDVKLAMLGQSWTVIGDPVLSGCPKQSELRTLRRQLALLRKDRTDIDYAGAVFGIVAFLSANFSFSFLLTASM